MKSKNLIFFLAILLGLVVGVGVYTFIYGQGHSYLLDDPKSCTNCHIMRDQYESWNRSSHHHVTTCNSCHTPENLFSKYFNKAENGFMHSLKFTTGRFKEPIKIREHNFNITMKACLKCHSELMNSLSHQNSLQEGRSCVHCHKEVGHTH